MDGNGRWAAARGLPVAAGHRAGHARAAADRRGGDRPRRRRRSPSTRSRRRTGRARPTRSRRCMEILGETIDRELPDLAQQGVRTRFIGRRDRVPPDAARRRWSELEARDGATSTRSHLWIAFDYGGRAELVEAARRLVEDGLAAGRGRRGGDRGAALRARAPRSRPPDPHLRRAADLELPALADRVRGARLHRHALARLRRATTCGRRSTSTRAARPAVRRPMSAFWSRIVVALVLLPLVLGVVWLGGWWLFAARARRRPDRAPRAVRDGARACGRSCSAATSASS